MGQSPNHRRRFLLVSAIAALPLLPFLDHGSSRPFLLSYSLSYVLFLAALPLLAAGWAWLTLRWAGPKHPRAAVALTAAVWVGVLIAELILGYRGSDAFAEYRRWGHMRSPLMGFEPAPNNHWELDGIAVTTDAHGFRTHVAPRPKAALEQRIFVLGESSAFGFGLPDDGTWPALLEGHLRERVDGNITVINAAASGHAAVQQLVRLHIRVLPLEPRLVLYYGAINDVYLAHRGDVTILMPRELIDAVSSRDYLRRRNRGVGFYFENSLLLNAVVPVVRRLLDRPSAAEGQALASTAAEIAPAQASHGRDDLPTRRIKPGFLDHITAMQRLSEARGSKFAAVTFIADHAHLPPTISAGIRDLNDQLRDAARTGGLPIIDIDAALRDHPDPQALFADDHYHPSPQGAAFIAEHIASALASQGPAGRETAPAPLVEKQGVSNGAADSPSLSDRSAP